MKGKILKTLSAMAITTALVAAFVVPTAAAVTYGDGVEGNEVSFKKILVTDADTECPAATFSYTVSAGSAIQADGTKAAVLPGPDTGDVSVDDVTYAVGTAADTTAAVSGKNTYTKAITVDLTDVHFKEPGIYRYYIQETIPSATGAFYYDVASDALTTNGDGYRTLDVYVEDATTDTAALVVTGYVLYDGQVNTAPDATTTDTATNTGITSAVAIGTNGVITADASAIDTTASSAGTKTDNIMNYYQSYDLTISKTVTGNQGSRDEYFSFTVEITAPAGSKFSVDTSSNYDTDVAANTINGEHTNPTELEVASGETSATATFWLQNGQNVKINGIGAGTGYSVTEGFDTNSPLGYTVTATLNDADQELDDDNGFSSTLTADTTAAFTNAKNGIIPTGVLLTATPVIVVGVLVVAGIAFFAVKSAKRKAAEAAEAESEE